MEDQKSEREEFVHLKRLYVGEQIRQFREKRNLSQEELAEMMGISRATISKIENGRFAISVDYLAKFSFHLNFDFLITGTNGKNNGKQDNIY